MSCGFSSPPHYTKLKLRKNSGNTRSTLFVGWGGGGVGHVGFKESPRNANLRLSLVLPHFTHFNAKVDGLDLKVVVCWHLTRTLQTYESRAYTQWYSPTYNFLSEN